MFTCRTCIALCSEIIVTAAYHLLTMCAPTALVSYFLNKGGTSWDVLQCKPDSAFGHIRFGKGGVKRDRNETAPMSRNA